MKNKKKIIISQKSTIRDAMKSLELTAAGIVMVVDRNRKLIGVATDGDIRRALLNKRDFNTPVTEIMNTNPIVIKEGYSKTQALRTFSEQIKQIPVVDNRGKILDILLYSEFCNIGTHENNFTIRAKAPLRISFAGGGTDVNPYIETKGGVALNTTINKYCYGTLKKRNDSRIIINSRDYNKQVEIDNIESLNYDGNLDLLKAVLKLMNPDFGMDIYFQSDVPPGTGLGGSATIAAVAAGLLNHARKDKLDDYHLAEIAFQAERIEINISGGWQDQYASVFGGFNFIEFKKKEVLVHPLRIKEDILNELECSLLLCFTGKTRISGEIVGRQTKRYLSKNKKVTTALDQTFLYAVEMKNALLRGDLMKFGRLLNKVWMIKKQFDNKIANSVIDRLYDAGIKAGAIGGKVLGAGGGGYILFFCPHLIKPEVARALDAEGGEIMDFSFDSRGLQTWSARQDIGER